MVPVFVLISILLRAVDAALRIFGGNDVDPEVYPSVVSIEMKIVINEQDTHLMLFSHMCTASALTPTWTLSAGHCIGFEAYTLHMQAVMPSAEIKYVIRYGSTAEPHSTTDSFSDIIKTVKHPAYKNLRTKFGDSVTNDVGLLKTTPIKLHQYGKLSAVEYPSLMGHEAVAMGYGIMHDGENVGSTIALGKPLQAINVLIKSCERDLTRGSLSPMICLSAKCSQPASVCLGDSGGPLVHFSGVVGINQMGATADCEVRNAKSGLSSNLVGIITPISPYIEWITDQIRDDVVV